LLHRADSSVKRIPMRPVNKKREGESGDRSSTFPTCHLGKMIYELFGWNPRLNASAAQPTPEVASVRS
jgi:hypothetical protein